MIVVYLLGYYYLEADQDFRTALLFSAVVGGLVLVFGEILGIQLFSGILF